MASHRHEYDYKGHDLEQELQHSSIVSRILSLTYYTLLVRGPTFVKTTASTELNRHSTNILIVKDTMHTRLKEIHAKATVIALASFDVGRLKKSLKEDEEEEEEEEEEER